MPPVLLALASDRLPNYEAIALSPGVGWFFLGAIVCLALFFLAHEQAWRKFWLETDDPRPLAAMRILFGFCALCNVNGLWELFEYLFMDEGMFTTDVAQHYRARGQFAGFGDGMSEKEPWGFFGEFGTWAWFESRLEWLEGPNYSPLLFKSTPTFFWTYLVIFEISMVMLIVGFQTKWIKWVAWFLYMGIILRNTLFWEATENVYRVFFFYLLLSRCGEAWSVDNWLRCRKLKKQGKLSTRDGPGEGAGAVVDGDGEGEGRARKLLEPIYRPIPVWPRRFVILNIATLYCATGTLKNGPVWNRGDAFYYAFNLDHFYRLPPQQLSAYFGTTLFKLNTWIVHWWEALFPLLVFGLILRWHRREKLPRLDGWRKWMARIGLGGFVAWFYVIILWSYPVHYRAPKHGLRLWPWGKVYVGNDAVPAIQRIVGVCVPIVAVIVVLGFRWLRDRQDVPRSERRRVKWLDLDWVCRWLFGRRLWLMLGLIFHGHLIVTMNIGWFSPGLLACYVAFLNGDELALLTTKIGQFFHQKLKLPMPAHVRAGTPTPSADPSLPSMPKAKWTVHRDGYVQSWAIVATSFGLALLAVLRRIQTDEDMWVGVGKIIERHGKVELPPELLAQVPEIQPNWFVLMIGVMALIAAIRRQRGYEFNPYFGPVILLTAWLGSVLAERELVAMIWVVLAVAILSVGACRVKIEAPAPLPVGHDPETGVRTRPWAYGHTGRTFIMVFVLYHLCAVVSTQLPAKDSWSTFHRDVDTVFRRWLQNTQTTQGWGMFAPNPPRSNVFLRVTVTDQEGEIYDLNTDVYACFIAQTDAEREGTAEAQATAEAICEATYPLPWIWYSRQRKMNRRIAGSEGGHGSWYQKWHARWVCRTWEESHGELPYKVTLYKVVYPMKSPKQVFRKPYDPRAQYNQRGTQKEILVLECKNQVGAQMPNEHRVRHGMPELEDNEIREWNKNRCRKWEEKLIEDAREEEGEVDLLDPRFDVCPAMPRDVRREAVERDRTDLLDDDDEE